MKPVFSRSLTKARHCKTLVLPVAIGLMACLNALGQFGDPFEQTDSARPSSDVTYSGFSSPTNEMDSPGFGPRSGSSNNVEDSSSRRRFESAPGFSLEDDLRSSRSTEENASRSGFDEFGEKNAEFNKGSTEQDRRRNQEITPESLDPADLPVPNDRQHWLNMNSGQRRTMYIVVGAIAVLILIPLVAWLQKASSRYVFPTKVAQKRISFEPMRPKNLPRAQGAPGKIARTALPEISPGSRIPGSIQKTPRPRIGIESVIGVGTVASVSRTTIKKRIEQLVRTASLLGDVPSATRLRVIDAIEVCLDQLESDQSRLVTSPPAPAQGGAGDALSY